MDVIKTKRMKSIKEKSEEHLNSVYAGYDNVLKTLVKEGYEAGANYVLREIEKILVAACEQYTSKQAVALNTEIYNKIKELESNQ